MKSMRKTGTLGGPNFGKIKIDIVCKSLMSGIVTYHSKENSKLYLKKFVQLNEAVIKAKPKLARGNVGKISAYHLR